MKSIAWKLAAAAVALMWAASGAVAQEKWLLSSMSPGGSSNSKLFASWSKRVSDASKGTLSIDVRDGVSLASFDNAYDRVLDDVLQVGWTFHQMYRSKWPRTEVAGLPFVADDEQMASEALLRLYKTGMLDAEYTEIRPIFMVLAGFTGLHFAKAPASLDDLGKYKVRVQGAAQTKMAELLGMSPQSVPANDMYVTLQRGTIDAVLTSWSAYAPYKLWEVSSYHIEAPLGTSSNFFFVSRKKYDAMPADARRALDMFSGDAVNKEFAKHFIDQANDGRDATAKSGTHQFVKPSPVQLANWEKKIGQPVIDDWVKVTPDGAQVLAKFKELYAQVKAGK